MASVCGDDNGNSDAAGDTVKDREGNAERIERCLICVGIPGRDAGRCGGVQVQVHR